MNRLKADTQAQIVSALVEGNSIRSIERMTGCHRDTIMRLGVRVGRGCASLMDTQMRELSCTHLQCDEIWAFVGKKQKQMEPTDSSHRLGDQWTFVAMDADTKLVPSFLVGKRSLVNAMTFLHDVAWRMARMEDRRIQVSTDGLVHYKAAVEAAFGSQADYGQQVKSYTSEGTSGAGGGRYSPPAVVSSTRTAISGTPDVTKISTSLIERQNLTMRMQMRRFTRLTNAFSKKLEHMKAAVALHFAHYNLVRIHKTLRTTPAMAAGVTSHLWTVNRLVECAIAREEETE